MVALLLLVMISQPEAMELELGFLDLDWLAATNLSM
jgi:hypothetical protein